MEFPFSSKEKGINYWASMRAQANGLATVDGKARNSVEEPIISDMNFDTYAGWCSSPATEQMLAPYGFSSLQSLPMGYHPYDHVSFADQSNTAFSVTDAGGSLNALGSPLSCMDRLVFPMADSPFSLSVESFDENDSGAKHNNDSSVHQTRVPRPLGRSLADKMLTALSLFKESTGGGILAQLWVPIKTGNHYILSTCEQPYLLDQMLVGYREVSRSYNFSVEQTPGSFPGLPGRVFMSKIPEWTSNVSYYNTAEYLRAEHAIDHEVRGSVALPIFDSEGSSCAAVLELVMMKEKPHFYSEMETVCHALQVVNLKTTGPSQLHPQHLSMNQRTALAEITDVLRAVCHAHRLPLALTWIPCTSEEVDDDEVMRLRIRGSNSSSNTMTMLCVEETACYVNDRSLQGFLHACSEHPLEEGQGVAGKALQSNIPFFFPDIKKYHINEYPLVQHARKFGLNAAVAIRLRSIHTGTEDYILEIFLPLNMTGMKEQQLLLDSLSVTMHRICRSLRTVTDAELMGTEGSSITQDGGSHGFSPISIPSNSSQPSLLHSEFSGADPSDLSSMKHGSVEADGSSEQTSSGSRRQVEKKRNTSEKTVSLSVLQQYFSGSLKDAATSIGVCPTTLKRICRQHGIARWPSRKINKVNRSLKKIQTVLDSVQGVEGGFKFDPTTGELLAAGSIIREFNTGNKSLLLSNKSQTTTNPEPATGLNGENSAVKLENDESYMTGNERVPGTKNMYERDAKKSDNTDCSEDSRNPTFVIGSFEHTKYDALPNALLSSKLDGGQLQWSSQKVDDPVIDEMDTEMEGDDGIIEHNQPSSSSMTDSSNSSGFMSTSRGTDTRGQSEEKPGLKITIKASYKEDTIRFKFDPSSGCVQLYEEVAKRFNLQVGTFQLKYLDDEDEWVMLVNDSDLQECLEIMEFVGKQSAKFLIRDLPTGIGSSGSSNCFLAGSS